MRSRARVGVLRALSLDHAKVLTVLLAAASAGSALGWLLDGVV